MRTSLRSLITVAAGLLLAAGTLAGPSPAQAETQPTVVASGLNNPRMLTFNSRGELFVAEAGTGGTGPCLANPEGGPDVCLGLTGSVTKIANGRQIRVLTKLPSLAGPGGAAAIGPTDLAITGRNHYALTIGLGQKPADRATLGAQGRTMGTVVVGSFPSSRPKLRADLAAFEQLNDPDGAGPDSNPGGITRARGGYAAVDAGGNTLLHIDTDDWSITTLAVFPKRMMGAPFPSDAVPTSVAVGPDGAYYVSQLTGFPFPPGAANVYRVVPGSQPTVFATGLTNVTDLAWYQGRLYVVQLSDAGLANTPENQLPMGSLIAIAGDGTKTTVAAGLPAPYGVALRAGAAYVTTCSVCAGGGGVSRIPLS